MTLFGEIEMLSVVKIKEGLAQCIGTQQYWKNEPS
jgi:hypothetical protein